MYAFFLLRLDFMCTLKHWHGYLNYESSKVIYLYRSFFMTLVFFIAQTESCVHGFKSYSVEIDLFSLGTSSWAFTELLVYEWICFLVRKRFWALDLFSAVLVVSLYEHGLNIECLEFLGGLSDSYRCKFQEFM